MAADKIFFSIAFACLILTACSQVKNDSKKASNDLASDTAKSTEEFVELGFYEALQEFRALYDRPTNLDTTITIDQNTFRLIVHHNSLLDSIIVPQKYNWGDNKYDYGVRTFASTAKILKNNNSTVEVIIKKENFALLLDESLNKYGVLLYPTYEGYDSAARAFIVNYSVSIPCTDVGKSVSLRISLDGKLSSN
jgi:hypothetical protein